MPPSLPQPGLETMTLYPGKCISLNLLPTKVGRKPQEPLWERDRGLALPVFMVLMLRSLDLVLAVLNIGGVDVPD